MTTAESIRNWFFSCPVVKPILDFNTDYLGDNSGGSIFIIPAALAYSEDITGKIIISKDQKVRFIFVLRAPYGDDVEQNLENLSFFDQLTAWMYQQNDAQTFPKITEGEVKSILPVQTGYVSRVNADSATYEMQCELSYWRSE